MNFRSPEEIELRQQIETGKRVYRESQELTRSENRVFRNVLIGLVVGAVAGGVVGALLGIPRWLAVLVIVLTVSIGALKLRQYVKRVAARQDELKAEGAKTLTALQGLGVDLTAEEYWNGLIESFDENGLAEWQRSDMVRS